MRLLGAVFLGFTTVSCSNPATAPSRNDTAATGDVALTLRVGEHARLTSTVVLGRGGAHLLTSGWHSETPSVAEVSDGGLVTGVSNGRAVMSVGYGGQQRRREVRVVPDFEGEFSGTYRISRCTPYPNESFRSWCAGLDKAVSPVTFLLSQHDDFVTGTFVAEGVTYPGFVVRITDDGLLEMTSRGVTAPARLTSASWSLTSSRARHLDGVLVWVRTGIGGVNGYSVAEGTVTADAR